VLAEAPSAIRRQLAIFREGLALARRAGIPFEQAVEPTRVTALSVESDSDERKFWSIALGSTIDAWHAAYDGRDTGFAL
jgi:hypothetical protein